MSRYYSQVVLADYPLIYYQLDEASGTVANDASGNGYNGTITGGITLGQSGAIAHDSDTAMLFNGSSGYINLPAAGVAALPSGASSWSAECWLNIPSVPAGYNLAISWGQHVSGGAVEFGLNSSGHYYVGFTSLGGASQSTSPSTGAWHHLVGTYDGATLRLYVDGTFITSFTATGAISTTSEVGYIGRGSDGTSWFNGTLDEVAIYGVALNQQQISSHYTAGLAQLLANYYYGNFQLNEHFNGLGYFLMSKDLDFPEFKPAISPLALYDGTKITGYQVPQRQIQCEIYVVGTSRTDCIARKDTMELYLAKRDQQLILHEDGRYWMANAISGKAKFAAGKGVVQAQIPVTFICANPYATAADAATPYDSGNTSYSTVVVAGTYQSPVFSVAGGGTVYSWPVLTLTHKLAALASTTTTSGQTQGVNYTSLAVVSAPALTAGQVLFLSWTTGGNTFVQKVVVSGTVLAGATSIPVNSWTASVSFPAGTTVSISAAWNTIMIAQLTDNYQVQIAGNNDQTYEIAGGNSVATGTYLLPQAQNDSIAIYCDPTAANGWTVQGSVQGVSFTYPFSGAPPPLEPGTTQWQVTISADNQPTADFKIQWSPRYLS